jgi:glycosyltransferase involved in cell wall biosynthesis
LTIGLPVYNGEEYLHESLDALLGQTFEEFQLVIADNASTDGTAAVARRYEKLDSRVRYLRQPKNVGASPNHNLVVQQCRTEFFKWASADDLYAAGLLEACVTALDEHPEAVLAHSWTAAVDGSGKITQAREYPLATDSPDAAVRLRSMLYGVRDDESGSHDAAADEGVIAADDFYGVMRTAVLQRVRPLNSYYYADRTLMTELSLFGRFHQTPQWLYFRRDHPDRAQHAHPTVRSRCANLDPRRANARRHPTARLFAEYVLGYAGAIQRAPLSVTERAECYASLAKWLARRGVPSATRAIGMAQRRPAAALPALQELPEIDLDVLVAGRAARDQA